MASVSEMSENATRETFNVKLFDHNHIVLLSILMRFDAEKDVQHVGVTLSNNRITTKK